MFICGKLIQPFSHICRVLAAIWSEFLLHDRKSSAGRLLKLVQNVSPLHPIWQGSSTGKNKIK
jgi:hypothetical protein